MIVLNLDKVMKARNVKLKDLAAKINLTDANLSNIKTGKIAAIRFSTLNALCKELNCQPADMLEYQADWKLFDAVTPWKLCDKIAPWKTAIKAVFSLAKIAKKKCTIFNSMLLWIYEYEQKRDYPHSFCDWR